MHLTRTLAGLGVVIGLLAPIGLTPSAGAADLPPPSVAPGEGGAPFTPILSQLVDPPPAMMGDDGKQHLAFELLVTNTSPRDATITAVTVRATSPKGTILQQLTGNQVAATMIKAGDLTLTQTAALPTYSTNELLLDATLPSGTTVPRRLSVELSATFATPLPGQPPYVSIYPGTVDEQLPAVPTSQAKPVVISPPLTGGDWVATNSCCQLNPHRGALDGGGGVATFPERYAIDFIRIDSDGNLYKPGETPSMSNNYSYGAKLLTVAPATVVAVQQGIPDQPPKVNPVGYGLNQLGGNYVVLKIRAHLYALYAHISPGTIKVKVGQKVKTGQVLGLLGNSGNSTDPHLHFQLMDGPGLLTSQGVPYEFKSFKLKAKPGANDTFEPVSPPSSFRDAYPLTNSLIAFPGAPSAPVSGGSPLPPVSTSPDA